MALKKVALVTGGASGIGLAVSKYLLDRSWEVVIGDVNSELGRQVSADLGCKHVHLDVVSETSWDSVAEFIQSEYKQIDGLVNNAGIYVSGNIEKATTEEWLKVQSVNVLGVLLGTQFAIRSMKGIGGAIVNLSSGAALRPNAQSALYSATKSAVWNLTRTTALHCAEQGYRIRCNSIHPGMVETEMVTGRAHDELSLEKLLDTANRIHPLGRMARPDDIAKAVAYLLSPESEYITGVALPVDGGYAIN